MEQYNAIEDFNNLSKRDQAQALNYIAYAHATGRQARRMHCGSKFSTIVLVGTVYGESHTLRATPEFALLAQSHPFVANVARLKAEGFRIRTMEYITHSGDMTVRRGIPMFHPETLQEVYVQADGRVRQVVAEGGKWSYKADIFAEAAV